MVFKKDDVSLDRRRSEEFVCSLTTTNAINRVAAWQRYEKITVTPTRDLSGIHRQGIN